MSEGQESERAASPQGARRSPSPARERSPSRERSRSRSPARGRSPSPSRSPDRRRRSPPRRSSRGTRVYVGRISSRTDEAELDYKFGKYGRIRAVDMKSGYAFVEFENEDDAEDAVRALDGAEIDSARVVVQMARTGGRAPRPPNPYRGVPPSHSDYRALFSYLPRSMSWQDLKDFCQQYAPRPVFTDVFRERGVYRGVAEFRSREDLKKAIRELDGRAVEGERIECYEDPRNRNRSRSRSRSRSPAQSPPRKRRRKESNSPRRSRSRERSRERSRSPDRSHDRDESPRRDVSPPPKSTSSP